MDRYERFKKIVDRLAQTFKDKNEDYGHSVFQTYEEFGDVSMLSRLTDKLNRLKAIEKSEGGNVQGESYEDTLEDLIVYGIIYDIALQEEEEGDSPRLEFPDMEGSSNAEV